MSLWLLASLHWLHVFFAIFWFGASLTINLLVIPAASLLPAGEQWEGWSWQASS